jgi:hypothetical protein
MTRGSMSIPARLIHASRELSTAITLGRSLRS